MGCTSCDKKVDLKLGKFNSLKSISENIVAKIAVFICLVIIFCTPLFNIVGVIVLSIAFFGKGKFNINGNNKNKNSTERPKQILKDQVRTEV